MKTEQYLNTFRVYCGLNDMESARLYIQEVMLYLLKKPAHNFQLPFSKIQQAENQLDGFYQIYFNALLFKVLKSERGDRFFNNSLLCEMFQEFRNGTGHEIFNLIEICSLILSNKNDLAVKKIISRNLFEETTPRSIQYFILEFIIKEMNPNEIKEELKAKIQHYQKNILFLDQRQIFISLN